MRKYVATYHCPNGKHKINWIGAEDFESASREAVARIEKEKGEPVAPSESFEKYKQDNFFRTEKRRLTSEAREYRLELERVRSYNQNRRAFLFKLQEFMPKNPFTD
jgi:hypothetical protein